jgi:DNA-binding winged helix-turn-helix (wHTH) protein
MSHSTIYCYEFGEFTLYPSDRLLLNKGSPINLSGKDFDVLVFLIERPNRLVVFDDLLKGVWKDVLIEESNITNNITKIRKALGDNRNFPKYIATVHGKGYRFIAEVKLSVSDPKDLSETDRHVDTNNSTNLTRSEIGKFQIESHKFVPVYLSEICFENNEHKIAQENVWASYRELKTDFGRLCILPFGIGVWHLTEKVSFSNLTDFAIWRQKTYQNIKQERHPLTHKTEELIKRNDIPQDDLFLNKIGKSGYILSLLNLKTSIWEKSPNINTALKLLACPTHLLSDTISDSEREKVVEIENQFLQNEFSNRDVKEFGLAGIALGFASWTGVSYYQTPTNQSSLFEDIIEFEIAVQATWWLSHCLREICLSFESADKHKLQNKLHFLIKQFGKLKTIGPRESISQRMMHEAILSTSRLEELVEDTLKLYNQL